MFHLFTFHNGKSNFLLPQRKEERKQQGRKWGKGNHPKVSETQGFLNLGHSNWTFCHLLSWFCLKMFPPFYLSYWEVQFLITPERERERGRKEAAGQKMGKRELAKSEWDTEVSVLRGFKLDNLKPIKLILSQMFPPFYLSFWEVKFLITPEREEGRKQQWLKMGKRESAKSYLRAN